MCHINYSADEVEFPAEEEGCVSGKVWFDCYNDLIKTYFKLRCAFMTKLQLVKGLC